MEATDPSFTIRFFPSRYALCFKKNARRTYYGAGEDLQVDVLR